MLSSRLEAFSDGVIAIVITIMVLELHVPREEGAAELLELLPVLLSYALSFLTVAIYWLNHHNLIHLARRVTTRLLWANVHFLFWLSLLPFVTGYLGAHPRLPIAAALYGAVASGCSLAFMLMRHVVVSRLSSSAESDATHRHRRSRNRGVVSALLLLASIPLAFVSTNVAVVMFCLPPLMYFLPDERHSDSNISDEGSQT